MWREYELLCLASMRHHSGVPGQIRLLMAEMRLNFSKTSRKLKLISATQTSGKFGGKWVFVQNVLDKYAVIEQIFYTYRRNTQKFKKIYTRYIAYWISQFRPQQHWFMAIINAEVFQEDSSYV